MQRPEQLIVTAGYPVQVGDAVVMFDRAERHTNSYSVWVRVAVDGVTIERELFKGDELGVEDHTDSGRWVLTGFRDEAGAGVHRPDGFPPVTMVFRKIRPGELGAE